MNIQELGKKAKQAEKVVQFLTTVEKNAGLLEVATELEASCEYILNENSRDIEEARKNHMSEPLIDRLTLTKKRIHDMADGLRQISNLPDPIGEVTDMKVRPNGLRIGRKRVPLGVVGIIYEARPNVTADAFGLCFKTGNVTILKGGSDAISSNIAVVNCIQKGLCRAGLPKDAVLLVEDTNREAALELMRSEEYLDVLIPRGGRNLIKTVVENSTVPVIETGTGNCHIFVDESADINMAVSIIVNAKTQRLGVCNACESLVIHKNIADEAVPKICEALWEKGVKIMGDEAVIKIEKDVNPASEEDWGREYLDAAISIKIVNDIEEAVDHINTYNTGHSESIITKSYDNALYFQDRVDAAAVYVNASTRFTDGNEFGFGAEIGISTQKLHARGPMGLDALTTTKYIIFGNGQIRS